MSSSWIVGGVAPCLAVFCVAAGSPLGGQEFRIGFVGGAPITANYSRLALPYPGDPVNPPNLFKIDSGQRSFIAGVSLETLLSRRLAVEGNVLHRDLWARTTFVENPGTNAASTDIRAFVASTTWEFPVLFKYTMGGSRWRPFVDGGVSFRSLERTSSPGPSRHGWSGGAGVALGFGRLQVAPQLRYTRWAKAESNGYYDTKRDQLELLTSFSGRMPTAGRLGKQRLTAGVLGGARLNETLAGTPNRLSRRAFGGVSLDVNLASAVSIEGDAIYKPIGISKNSVLTWEFPVLVKYRWKVGGARLFGEAGPSFRASGNLQSSVSPSRYGVAAGGGIEKRAGQIRIAPGLRYTRWSESDRGYRSERVYSPNSMDVVIGLSF